MSSHLHPGKPFFLSCAGIEFHHTNASNSHVARPVHLIITMIKWIRTSKLSIKESLCEVKFIARRLEKDVFTRINLSLDAKRKPASHVTFTLRVEASGFRVQGSGLGVDSSTESCTKQNSSRFKNNCFAVLISSSKEGSYLRLVDFCITQL